MSLNDGTSLLSQWNAFNKGDPTNENPKIEPLKKYVASEGQKRLFFLDQLHPNNPVYNLSETWNFRGNFEKDLFLKAWKYVGKRHSNLRTCFILEEEEICCLVKDDFDFDYEYVDLEALKNELQSQKLHEISRTKARMIFDLSKAKLCSLTICKISNSNYSVLVNMHHIICDKWSMRILRTELSQVYQMLEKGQAPELPTLSKHYSDYVKSTPNQKDNAKLLDYWKGKLNGASQYISVPPDKDSHQNNSLNGRYSTKVVPAELFPKIKSFCREHRVTAFNFFLSIFKLLTHKYSSENDIILGTPFSTRSNIEYEKIVGFFNDTIVLRTEMDSKTSYLDFLSQTKETVLEAFENKDIGFQKIISEINPNRSSDINPIFQMMFLYHHDNEEHQFSEGVELFIENFDIGVSKFDLTLYVAENKTGFEITIEYATDLYTQYYIERFLTHFVLLTDEVLKDFHKPIGNLNYLSNEEKSELLRIGSGPKLAFDERENVVTAIFTNAVPTEIALTDEFGTMSYKELDTMSNGIAAILKSKPPQSGLVGILMDQSNEFVVSMIGIMKAGLAYLPLDISYPANHIEKIIDSSGVEILVSTQKIDKSKFDCEYILYEDVEAQEEFDFSAIDSSKPAYVIFTSGSTGTPNGVVVSHANLFNSTKSRFEFYDSHPSSFLMLSSFSFDSSVAGIYWTLLNGGKLVVPKKESVKDTDLITRFISEQQISHTLLIPSLYQVYLEFIPIEVLSNLEVVILAGEVFSKNIAVSHLDKLSTVRIYNEYGPTEATVWSSGYELTTKSNLTNIPIGQAVANNTLFVLDANQNLLPSGMPGELYISGASVTSGYLNSEQSKNDKFLTKEIEGIHYRLYRTGDWARFDNEEDLIFLGRRDHQVKIRGHRIELGEIDAIIKTYHQDVDAVTVYLKKRNVLCSFIVGKNELNTNKLSEFLKVKLPKHFCPDQLIEIEAFPLMPNGKVDYLALKGKLDSVKKVGNQGAQHSATEEKILSIWREILQDVTIGIDDNFFECGGDSIQIIRIVAKARKEGYKITPKDIYAHQTVREISQRVQIGIVKSYASLKWEKLPITPMQEWFFDTHKNNPNYWLQGYSFKLNNAVSRLDLENAIAALISNYPIFNLCFVNEYGKWFHQRKEFSLKDFILLDEASETGFDCINIQEGPLMKFIVKNEGNEIWEAKIIIHHLIVDAVSWVYILDFLAARFGGQSKHSNNIYVDYFSWVNRISQLATTEYYDKFIPYWNDIFSYKSKYFSSCDLSYEKDVKTISAKTSAPDVQQLRELAQQTSEFKISELIISSFLQVFNERTSEKELTVMIEGHGRDIKIENFDLNESVGWHTSYFPVHFNLTKKNSVLQSLIDVKEQLRKAPENGHSFGVLKYLSKKLRGDLNAHVVINYLGDRSNHDSKVFEELDFIENKMRDERSERDYLIEINSWIENGVLRIVYSYDAKQLESEEMKTWLDLLMEKLKELPRQLESVDSFKTPSDFNYVFNSADINLIGKDLSVKGLLLSDAIDLSATQSAMLFHHLHNRNSDEGLIIATADLVGKLEVDVLNKSWEILVSRHDALRCFFMWDGLSKPAQIFTQDLKSKIEIIQLSDAEHIDKRMDSWLEEKTHSNLDLNNGPIHKLVCFRKNEQINKLVFICHHIYIDGWSTSNLLSELMETYNSVSKDLKVELQPITPLVDWKQQFDFAKEEYQTTRFWNKYLLDLSPCYLKQPNSSGYKFETRSYNLSQQRSSEIEETIKKSKITLNIFFVGIWSYLLSKYLNREKIIVGLTQSGRSLEVDQMDKLIGMFSSVLPTKIKIDEAGEIDFLKIQNTLNDILVRDAISLEDMKLSADVPKGNLFDSLIVVENFLVPKSGKHGLSIRNFKSRISSTIPFCLIIIPGDELEIKLRYNSKIFQSEEIELVSNDILALSNLLELQEGKAKTNYEPEFKIEVPQIKEELTPMSSTPIIDSSLNLDEQLKVIWKDILKIDQISLKDNFFDLGGKSIQAVRIFNRINEELGYNASPILLLKYPSIGELSKQISSNELTESWECVYPLKEQGTLAPLFCFHAGDGHIMFYKEFAESIDIDRPVYGIQPVGLDGSEIEFDSIKSMAEFYLSEIKKKHPEGPYHLLGTCFSNAVTFEIAKTLKSEIGRIIIVDSPPPYFNELSKVTKWLNWIVTFNTGKLREAFGNYFKYARLKEPTDTQEKHLFNTGKRLRQVMSTYKWNPEDIEIVLLRSSQNKEDRFKNYHISNWKLLAQKGLVVRTISGTHGEIFEGASAGSMALITNELLSEYDS